MRRIPLACRLALAGGAILLALAGCSGGSKTDNAASTSSAAATSHSSAAASTTSSAPAPAGDAAFCGQAQTFVSQVQAIVAAQAQQQDLGQKLPALVGQRQSVTPPPAIAGDWQTALSALQQLGQAFQGVNLSDPQQLQQLETKVQPIETQLGAAGQHIEDYLRTQCGITIGSSPSS